MADTELMNSKIHNLQRTKLRLKNQLNTIIDELKLENTALKQKNAKLTEKVAELAWANDWDNVVSIE
jgi:hypothetical protein